ncbi:MAG: PucR family transcriptional regulator, proline-responsive transcriptional activator [Thermacetogenium sp.]|nr:PucR family transcriptional regulator, proline-responsive transcriptional activator [Thermacetogenium sp.]
MITKTTRASLIDSVLQEQSLCKVIAYLQSVTGRSVIITDRLGKVYANSPDVKIESPDDLYLQIPFQSRKRFYYQAADNTLYYYTGFTDKDACILLVGAEEDRIKDWKKHLEKVSLAVKTYILLVKETEKAKNQFTSKLIEDILVRNVCNIKDLIKQYNFYSFDLNKLYYVAIMEPEPIPENKLKVLHAHTQDWLKHNNLDIICSIWNKRFIVFVCPTHFDQQTLEADLGWEKHLSNIRRHQKDILNFFNISTSFGIGRKYPLHELHRSYQEAMIALNISKLTGKKHFVAHFLDLGLFSLINFQDIKLLKRFCFNLFGELLQHDRANKWELLSALRALFNTNFNVNEAAQEVYVHPNTLRYRIKKIEELTGMKLERMEEKINLFVAVNLYELLRINGLLDNASDDDSSAAPAPAEAEELHPFTG